MENLVQSCLYISNPLASWICLQIVAAELVVMLMSRKFRSVASCTCLSPCSIVSAAPRRSASVSSFCAAAAASKSCG